MKRVRTNGDYKSTITNTARRLNTASLGHDKITKAHPCWLLFGRPNVEALTTPHRPNAQLIPRGPIIPRNIPWITCRRLQSTLLAFSPFENRFGTAPHVTDAACTLGTSDCDYGPRPWLISTTKESGHGMAYPCSGSICGKLSLIGITHA